MIYLLHFNNIEMYCIKFPNNPGNLEIRNDHKPSRSGASR